MEAHEALEHSEHISHASHGNPLGTYIGITMAILGVLLAFCSAKVGGERTELVQTLVEQQNAHAKYQAQDIKHRVAFLNLQTTHAMGATGGANVDKKDIVAMAKTVDRYLEESEAAKEWVESFEPIITGHVHAQEYFEIAQLCAEVGIVIASVALLMKKKAAWYAALLLGFAAIATVGFTYQHQSALMATAGHKVEELGTRYRALRNANKTTAEEKLFTEEILKSARAAVPAAHKDDPLGGHD